MLSFILLPSRLYCRFWNCTKSAKQLFRSWTVTTGRELHPALKNFYICIYYRIVLIKSQYFLNLLFSIFCHKPCTVRNNFFAVFLSCFSSKISMRCRKFSTNKCTIVLFNFLYHFFKWNINLLYFLYPFFWSFFF